MQGKFVVTLDLKGCENKAEEVEISKGFGAMIDRQFKVWKSPAKIEFTGVEHK